jgi:hypothetical protein
VARVLSSVCLSYSMPTGSARVVLCWFGSLTAGTVGIGELCPPLQLLSPPFAAATQLGGGVLVCSHGARARRGPPEVGMRGGLPHCVLWQHEGETSWVATEVRNREKVKHSPYRRSTRRAIRRKPRTSNPTSPDGRSFEGTNRRARSVMPDQWLRVYNAMHTPVSTETSSTLTTANPARTEHIPTGRVP